MATIKATVRKDKVNKAGLAPIYINYIHKRKFDRLPIGLQCRVEHFDGDSGFVTNADPDYKRINTAIKAEIAKLARIERELAAVGTEPTFKNVREVYDAPPEQVHRLTGLPHKSIVVTEQLVKKWQDEDKQKLKDESAIFNDMFGTSDAADHRAAEAHFLGAWGAYYDYCKKEKDEGTWIRVPNNLLILQKYCKHAGLPLTFAVLTEDFYIGFKDYMLRHHFNYITKRKGVTNGTLHNVTKSIRAFLNWAVSRKFSSDLEFKKWVTTKPKTDLQYLTEEQLQKLVEVHLRPGSSQEVTRDLWVFMAFTGLRYSDVSSWVPENVNRAEDVIELRSEKARKDCIVPIFPTARAILEKYNYDLPKQANHKLNLNIKEILAELGFNKIMVKRAISVGTKDVVHVLPLSEAITVHSGRRTFINMMINKGEPVTMLSTMTGNDIRSLMIYYKNDKKQVRGVADRIKFFEDKQPNLKIA